MPSLTAAVNRAMLAVAFRDTQFVDTSHKALIIPFDVPAHAEMELAIPVANASKVRGGRPVVAGRGR